MPSVFETHGRLALLSVRPFVGGAPTTTASADFSRRLTASPFQAQARSPRVRDVSFPTQPPDLRRAPWSRELRGHRPARPRGSAASYPVPVRRLVGSACRFLQPSPRGRGLSASLEIPVT